MRARALYLDICKANDNYDITNVQIMEDMEGEIRKGEAIETTPPDYRAELSRIITTTLMIVFMAIPM